MATGRALGRGEHLLDAALAILADEGFGALSMRSVAARAGVSLAQVQYYFRTRSELVAAAFDHASTEFLASLQTIPEGEPSLSRLRDVIWLWLPLDAEREKRARVWLAYAAVAASDERLAAAAAHIDADLRAWFSEQFGALKHMGVVRPDLDPEVTAMQLLALIDGLTVHALVLPVERRSAVAENALGSWLVQLARRG